MGIYGLHNGMGLADGTALSTTAILTLNAGEYVEVQVYQTSGGPLNAEANLSWASMAKVA